MRLPQNLEEKISKLYFDLGKKKVSKAREHLTEKYKTQSGQSVSLINSKEEGMLYAISRMPATYAVIFSLIKTLIEQGLIIGEIKMIADFGSGTGAGFFACQEIFKNATISAFEYDENMIKTFNLLTENMVEVKRQNLCVSNENFLRELKEFDDFDLSISSFVLSEMNDEDREIAFKNLLSKTKKYLLLIDTGTPKTYSDFMKFKHKSEEFGFRVVAPCLCEKCPLENDYCQFYARVERAGSLRQSKGAEQSYEDEKYFYLLLEKIESNLVEKKVEVKSDYARVIRRPIFAPGKVELVLCGLNGVQKKIFTKRQKELYKQVKKSKINDLVKIV